MSASDARGGRERRRAVRVPMEPDGPVTLIGGRLLSLSTLGMLIESPLVMEPNSVHRFRLVVQKEYADIDARVAACGTGEKHRYPVGLEFIDLDEGLRARIAELLKSLPADRS